MFGSGLRGCGDGGSDGCFRSAEQDASKGGKQYFFAGNTTLPPSPAWTNHVTVFIGSNIEISMRAICVAAPAGALLWILGNTGVLSELAVFFDPVGRFIGMNGMILLAFFFSLPANELLIPVIMMAATGAGSLAGVADVSAALLLNSGITWQIALRTMVFTLFHWPCATTLMTIQRETGSMKKTAAAFFLPTAVGIILCVILRLILNQFGS